MAHLKTRRLQGGGITHGGPEGHAGGGKRQGGESQDKTPPM